MLLILLSLIVAAILIAISMMRHRISFVSLIRAGIAKENSIGKERAEQSRFASSTKQFLVVVLPDGKVVNPLASERF